MHAACLVILLVCLWTLPGETSPHCLHVTVTAYASGWVTASGTRPAPGVIALSRDVERALGVRFGDRVTLEGLGTYRFTDRMPWYWHRRVDLYMSSRRAALTFGKRLGSLCIHSSSSHLRIVKRPLSSFLDAPTPMLSPA